MKKIFFSLVCMAFLLSSCGENAAEVNGIINIQVGAVNDAMQTISDFINTDKYDEAKMESDSLAAKVLRAQETIKKIENKKAATYKQSALDYLSFVGDNAPETFAKVIEMFKAAKEREQKDVASGKQSATKINFGPDFDAAREMIKKLRIELKKNQTLLLEKQEKFLKANGLATEEK